MKSFIFFSLILFSILFANGIGVRAQHKKLTVILLRHAEKDASDGADAANPELSAEGKARAQKLVKILDEYKPDAIYSTDMIRAKATVLPFARKNRMMIFVYDERNLNKMRDLIMSGKIKRLVVVGHSDSTPALANLLAGKDEYKPLAPTEFDKILIVKIRKYKRKPDKVREKVIKY